MLLPIDRHLLFHIPVMSAYLENERAFSANVSDYLVILLNLCAYREDERQKDEREGQGVRGGKRKRVRGRGRAEREERERVIAVWVSCCICCIGA